MSSTAPRNCLIKEAKKYFIEKNNNNNALCFLKHGTRKEHSYGIKNTCFISINKETLMVSHLVCSLLLTGTFFV